MITTLLSDVTAHDVHKRGTCGAMQKFIYNVLICTAYPSEKKCDELKDKVLIMRNNYRTVKRYLMLNN